MVITLAGLVAATMTFTVVGLTLIVEPVPAAALLFKLTRPPVIVRPPEKVFVPVSVTDWPDGLLHVSAPEPVIAPGISRFFELDPASVPPLAPKVTPRFGDRV